MNKPELKEMLSMCDQLKALVSAIYAKKEIKKGDRGKWRAKARRLLRKIDQGI
jgi:hypothetical protein